MSKNGFVRRYISLCQSGRFLMEQKATVVNAVVEIGQEQTFFGFSVNFFKRLLSRKASKYCHLTFILVMLEVPACWACRAPPREQLVSVDEQIMLASDISVATVVRATPTVDGKIEYKFLVQKRIIGPYRNFFTVTGHNSMNRPEDGSFNRHQSEDFWQRGGGRLF